MLKLKKYNQTLYNFSEFNSSQKKFLVISIILLVVLGQLAITLYLPSMPNMVSYFKTDNLHIQLTLTLYLAGYGISQFFYGPLSDIYGRRLVILVGLSIFFIANLLAVFATTFGVFLSSRILQGIGIGCGDTMGRAILCDCFKANEFVMAACYIGLAATITPMIAPVIGGYIEVFFNWRANFIFILLSGMIVMSIIFINLPETKSKENASKINFFEIAMNYWYILRHRTFLTFFLPGLVSFVGETVYNIISPFLIQQQLKWGPVAFGWFTVIPVIGLVIGTFIVYFLNHRISYTKMVFSGVCIMSIAGITMLIFSLMGYFNILIIVGPMLVFMIGVGITYPNTNLGALTPFATTAGVAGALQGGLQMVLGGLFGTFLAHLHIETPFSLALILAVFSLGILIAFINLANLSFFKKMK
jgi:DHA1 family 2-module integral membrane pump EmrD-like MFS transporter